MRQAADDARQPSISPAVRSVATYCGHASPPCASSRGVAGRTVARLMADLPEIGLLSGKAIAKLAGLAPLADDSGARNGARRIRGGRAPVPPSSSSSPTLPGATIQPWPTSTTASSRPQTQIHPHRARPIGSSSASTPKHATREQLTPMHLDTQIVALPPGGQGGILIPPAWTSG